MADDAGTQGAGDSGDNGAAAQIAFQVPTEWASNDDYKGFFTGEGDSKAFDINALAGAYSEAKKAVPVVPETPDAYKAEFPDDWPLGDVDRQLQKETAKALGLTQEQYEGVVKFDIARLTRAAEEADVQMRQAREALQKEWKQDFDTNLAKAKMVSDLVFGEEFTKSVDLGNNPAFIRGLYALSRKMSEDTLKIGGMPAGGDTRPKGEDGKPRLKFPSMGD